MGDNVQPSDLDELVRDIMKVPYSKSKAKDYIAAHLARETLNARQNELNRKMTLHVELFSSKDFKAGFREAVDQIDKASDIRTAELQSELDKLDKK